MKKIYLIKGLDCANCASKIEDTLKRLEIIDNVQLNFMNEKLSYDVDKENVTLALKTVEEVIESIEEGVTLVDAERRKDSVTRVCKIDGLDCANCAAKIEKAVNDMPMVDDVNINLMGQTITIKAKESEIDEIVEKIKVVGKEIEDTFKIIDHNGEKAKKKIEINENSNSFLSNLEEYKHDLINIGFGAVTFIVANLLKENSIGSIVFFAISYIFVGREVLVKAVKNIFKGKIFDENFLMAIATVGAICIGEYSEGIAVMLFYQVGEFFQSYAVGKSRRSISELMDIKAEYANKKVGNIIEKVSPEDLQVNDIIVVKPGEKIPVDGVVISGISTLNTAALTGESVPREVVKDNDVLSGAINLIGTLEVKVTKAYNDSTVAKILDLVENASSKKSKTENFITKFARYYTPIVVITALVLAVIPPIIIEGALFTDWIYRALTFLVVSCPCALVISVPLSFFGGIGGASKAGVLVKGSNYLEALAKAEIIAFDKTGTLTKGEFNVTEIKAVDMENDKLLEIAALVENYSNHPVAKSILRAYGKSVDLSRVKDIKEIAGHGIIAKVDNKTVCVGNDKMMRKYNISFDESTSIGTVVYLATEDKYLGYVVISDEIKDDSMKAIDELKKIRLTSTVMLTGDNKKVADYVGNKIGLDNIYSELLPQDKVKVVEELLERKSDKGSVLFVGDGINDAPVLARADVGIAMGGVGSDSAIEAADVVLMTDEPAQISKAIKIARRTLLIATENIVFALAIKIIVLVLSALGLASMWTAVFADVGVAIIAILNAMRALKVN